MRRGSARQQLVRWAARLAQLGLQARAAVPEWSRGCFDLLFPPSCTFCACPLDDPPAGPPLCETCLEALQLGRHALCGRCASPVPPRLAGSAVCARCRDRRYSFARATALGLYRGQLREAVVRTKQVVHEPLAMALGRLLADHLAGQLEPGEIDLIAPAPVYWVRQWSRGTSCPALLADACRRRLALPAALDLLVCRRKIRKQGTLSPAERFRNVRGALAVSSGYDIRGARILLVDDVMTTGATASEAGRALRRAGATRVTVAVVARGTGAN